MGDPRAKVLSLQIKNFESRNFVPYQSLKELMSRDFVRAIISTCDLPKFRQPEVVEIVMRGARRILAILLVLYKANFFLHFIDRDNFQVVNLDHKLPYTLSSLSTIFESETVAKEFFDVQWGFVAPEFTYSALHRSLDINTVLPFVDEEKQLGEGGFGTVTEVFLPPFLQKSVCVDGHEISSLARKEFKSIAEGANHGAYQREESNLQILCRLKHPNIIRLISSYKFRGKVNFLFPRATGGNLHELLRSSNRPVELAYDQDFLIALCRLSSAVDAVHSFCIDELDLSMIGCHHDLKPRNILVDGRDFIIADFGLASLKQATESSKSDFVMGPAWYLAPECEDPEEGFAKHIISRPSDIWSFGCILAEVLTYLLKGADGVKQFERRRKVKLGFATTYTFHAGCGSPNPGVNAWFLELEHNARTAKPHLLELLALVRDMLALAPTNRPSSSITMLRLRHTYLSLAHQSLLEAFGSVLSAHDSYELKAEYERFKIWGSLLNLRPNNIRDSEGTTSPLNAELAFEPTVSHLKDMDKWLGQLDSIIDFKAVSVMQRPMVVTNDDLCKLLPLRLQQRLQLTLEQQLVSAIDAEELDRAQEALQSTPMHRRLGMLAAIKRVSLLAASRKKQTRTELNLDLQLATGLIQRTKRFAHFDLGFVTNHNQEFHKCVLLEFVKYDVHWEGPVSEEMIIRIEAIADMHSHEEKPEDLRSLHCLGFYHEAREHAFALVYDFPIVTKSEAALAQVYSLNTILERSKHWKERPLLDDRYKLAQVLAVSLLEFHNVSWLHRSLSPQSIIFFDNEGRTGKALESVRRLEDPYIIGFNRSRPDEPAAFTNGPDTHGEARCYQHPAYVERKHHYLPDFDYYSLGLVLLEIGLWMSLTDMTRGQRFPSSKASEERRAYLLLQRVPLLGHMVGREYAEAVRICLDDFGGVDFLEISRESKLLRFSDEVVARLRRLNRE